MDKILEFNKKIAKRNVPKIKAGDTVKVHQVIKEGEKERTQIFEGTVIKIKGGYGQNGTFTVRKIATGIGVEKIFPFMMPSISKIELVKRGKVRRAKLYYLREKQQKEARLKEKLMTEEEKLEVSYDREAEKKTEEDVRKKEQEKESKKDDKLVKEDKKEEPKKVKKPQEKEKKEEKKADKK